MRAKRRSGLQAGALAAVALAVHCIAATHARADPESSSFDLYVSDSASKALADAKRELQRAERNAAPDARWQHLMYVAWLEESLGEHRSSMAHATRALDIVPAVDPATRCGRIEDRLEVAVTLGAGRPRNVQDGVWGA